MNLTHIAGKLPSALGVPMQGAITITGPSFVAGDGTLVAATNQSVSLASDGSYSFHLAPTDRTSQFVFYTATYHLVHGGAIGSETWSVPTTAATVNIQQVKITKTIPPPPFAIQTSQIYSPVANIGDALLWNGQQWTPATILEHYPFDFLNESTIVIPGAMHGQGPNLILSIYDDSGNALLPNVNRDPITADVTITFGQPQSGFGVLCGGISRSLPNFAKGVIGGSTGTIRQAEHRFNTSRLVVAVYDETGNLISAGAQVSVSPAFDVSVTVGSEQNFTVVIMGGISSLPAGTVDTLAQTASFIQSVNGQTEINIPASVHQKGALAIPFCFTNNTPAQQISPNYTRAADGSLDLNFGYEFTGTVQIISAGYQGISGAYSRTVTIATNTLSIPASSHQQGVYALVAAFTSDSPSRAVYIEYTRDAVGNLNVFFNPPFTGAVEVYPGGWRPGTTLYTTTFENQPAVTIEARTHNKGTVPLIAAFSSESPAASVNCSWTRDAVGNITASFSPAFTGLVQVFQAE
jgi:hypothetical protein